MSQTLHTLHTIANKCVGRPQPLSSGASSFQTLYPLVLVEVQTQPLQNAGTTSKPAEQGPSNAAGSRHILTKRTKLTSPPSPSIINVVGGGPSTCWDSVSRPGSERSGSARPGSPELCAIFCQRKDHEKRKCKRLPELILGSDVEEFQKRRLRSANPQFPLIRLRSVRIHRSSSTRLFSDQYLQIRRLGP